jgi:hypothetical protein
MRRLDEPQNLFETDGEKKAKSLPLQEMETRSVILWPA